MFWLSVRQRRIEIFLTCFCDEKYIFEPPSGGFFYVLWVGCTMTKYIFYIFYIFLRLVTP